MTYPIVIVPLSEGDGGGFRALAPDLPGCVSDGETHVEAAASLLEAIDEWVDCAKKLGREVPGPGSSAQRVRDQRESVDQKISQLIQAIEAISNANEKMNERFDDLHDQVEEIRERLSRDEGWVLAAGLSSRASRAKPAERPKAC